MSLKTLKKWLAVISILLIITLSAKLSLDFIITMEEMRYYAIVFRFWRGIRDGCAFCTFLLAGIWIFIVFYSFFLAIAEPLREYRNNPPRREEDYEDDEELSWDDLYGKQAISQSNSDEDGSLSWDDLYGKQAISQSNSGEDGSLS